MRDWDDIVTRHGRIVWQTAWRMLGNHADALDCYQRTFLAALETARRETVRDWPALLRRLATLRALDLVRTRYRQARRCQPLGDPSSVVSSDAGPQKRAQEAELLERLRAALAELPGQQAEVFSLVALEGMSYRQVAARLKLSTSAAGMLLSRARKGLRERLVSFEPEPKRKD